MVFTLMRLIPGDPAQVVIGTEAGADQEIVEALRRQWGLDKPIYVQYVLWLGNVLRGDLGNSFFLAGRPVSTLILQKAPATLELAIVALIMAIVIAIPAGIIAATKEGTIFDYLVSMFVSMGSGRPRLLAGHITDLDFCGLARMVAGQWARALYRRSGREYQASYPACGHFICLTDGPHHAFLTSKFTGDNERGLYSHCAS